MKKKLWGQYVFLVFSVLVLASFVAPHAVGLFSARFPLLFVVGSPSENRTDFLRSLGGAGLDVSFSPLAGDSARPEGSRAALYLSSSDAPSGDEDSARAEADRWKTAAMSGLPLFAEAGAISADRGAAFSQTMADFLGVRRSGWSVDYVFEPEDYAASGSLSTSARAAFDARRGELDASDFRRACLVFERDDGKVVILERGDGFDGKAPLLRLSGRAAPLYARFYLNAADESARDPLAARGVGSLDLGLTERGRETLSSLGVPASAPAAIFRETPFSSTVAFNVDFSRLSVDYESDTAFGLAWFRANIAAYRPGSDSAAYWRVFAPGVVGALAGRAPIGDTTGLTVNKNGPSNGPVESVFRVLGQGFQKRDDSGTWRPFVIKGVNLGPALPGKAFTEFPTDEALYYRWFSSMTEMGLNSVRVYTLLPPAFYRALRAYNLSNVPKPLYLLQEIWPEENPPGKNCLDAEYTAIFLSEIERDIRAIHGDATIAPRKGRSWGTYSSDVSPWTVAYLLGRELEPDEVIATNESNRGYAYVGKWFSSRSGSPTEAWLASACDFAATAEIRIYGAGHALSVVSWPPLDPIPHWVEWRDPDVIASGRPPVNDSATLDIANIDASPAYGPGFFGSYHIYPNYPDFMVTTPWYDKYRDAEGVFRYGGYLREFMRFNRRYPALLAEYGLATSLGVAHYAPDGLNHGGVEESLQGSGIERMTKAALAEGFAGTVIFEWIDEWAKKTWTTEPLMVPLDRHMLWHNELDPEQHYGLIAMEGTSVLSSREISAGDGSHARSLSVHGDETWLSLSLAGEKPWDEVSGTVYVALDVADRGRGIAVIPKIGANGPAEIPSLPSGCEFLVEIRLSPIGASGRPSAIARARVLTAERYNIGKNSYSLDARPSDAFTEIRFPVNRLSVDSLGKTSPIAYANWSDLPVGNFADTRNCAKAEGLLLEVRLPWGVLNVADPSRLAVLDDPRSFAKSPAPDELRTTSSDGIIAYGAFIPDVAKGERATVDFFPRDGTRFAQTWRYAPSHWDSPKWGSRPKVSIESLKAFFSSY